VPRYRHRVARTAERTGTLLAAAIVPAVALAIAGAFHPHDLGPATARRWTDVHLVALPLFGLLGLAPWLLLRRRHRVAGLVGAVLAWLHAAFYTGLDVLAGIAAGTLQEHSGGAGVGDVFGRGDQLARVGTTAYLLVTVLAAASVLLPGAAGDRRVPGDRRVAWLGAVVVAVAAVSYLSSHIWWPRGGLTMLALGLGWALLVASTAPSRRGARDGRVTR